jgi:hypothetical protein
MVSADSQRAKNPPVCCTSGSFELELPIAVTRISQATFLGRLHLIPWFEEDCGPSGLPGSLPAVEKEVIALAAEAFREYILNVDGA